MKVMSPVTLCAGRPSCGVAVRAGAEMRFSLSFSSETCPAGLRQMTHPSRATKRPALGDETGPGAAFASVSGDTLVAAVALLFIKVRMASNCPLEAISSMKFSSPATVCLFFGCMTYF
jgi:hypothetical protein